LSPIGVSSYGALGHLPPPPAYTVYFTNRKSHSLRRCDCSESVDLEQPQRINGLNELTD